MRSALFAVVVLLFVLFPGRAVAADSCSRFAFEVAAAENAYADYSAYLKEGDSEELSIAFKVFSHLLDVADEYSQQCEIAGHNSVFKSYTRLEWYRSEYEYGQYVAGVSEEKRVIANVQSSELKLLWALGFGKSDSPEYSVMKSTTANHFAELGLTFSSPETGRVLVQGNAKLANCDKNDHRAGFAGVSLAYPEDAAKAKLGGRFDIDVDVDEKGVATRATANVEDVPGDPLSRETLNREMLAQNVQNELAAEAMAATWIPRVTACKPAGDTLMLTATLDPVAGTVTLEPWHYDP